MIDQGKADDALLPRLFELTAPPSAAAAHPGRAVVAVNARSLIRQNGSVHCLTMQLLAGLLEASGKA